MHLFHVSFLSATALIPGSDNAHIVAGFFASTAFVFLLCLQLFGARMFVRARERNRTAPKWFFIALLAAGAGGTLASCFATNKEVSLVLGVASGMCIWTALGDVAEQMKWISTLSKKAVISFLPCLAAWLALTFLIPGIPIAVKGSAGYAVIVWGLHLTRVRVLAKWGLFSLAATILGLVTAMFAGASLAIGMLHGTPFSGIIGGIAFGIATWSALEIIWERGMAQGPWKRLGKWETKHE